MKRTPLKRTGRLKRKTPLRSVSAKRRKGMPVYAQRRKAFLAAHPWCAVYAFLRSTEIHHVAGRSGSLYLDERQWLAVSAPGHRWIHRHPAAARAKGWIA